MAKPELLKLPKGWKLLNIGEVGEIVSGITLGKKLRKAKTRSVPYLRVANVKDGYLDLSNIYEIEATEEEIKKCQLKFGDILLTEGGDPDKLGRGTFWAEQIPECIHQNHIFRVRFDLNKFSPQFISAQIGSAFCKSYFLAHAKQTTGIATINQQVLAACPLIVPPLEEQTRIAAILEKCDRLRRTRRYALQLSNTFLQSAFLEMFGDPVTNPMEWKRAKVADLGNVQTGNTPSRDELDNYGNYIEWIKSDNIIDGELYVQTSKEMLSAKGLKNGRYVEAGSILVTCIAGSATSIGNIALTNRKVAFNQQINSVTPNKDVNSLFLYGLFLTSKPFIQRNTTLGMKRIITKSKFENLLLVKPPLSLQEKFAQIVQKFERLRTQQREAERQAEHLFQTLLYRAFRSELTSSDFDDEAVSALSQEIGVKQAKPKSTGEVAEYLHTKVSQQETEAVQLTLPGLE